MCQTKTRRFAIKMLKINSFGGPMNLGFTEVLVIVLLIVVLFGSKKIPELGSALGKSIQNFKKGLNQSDEDKK